jgi:hypothetical protein
VVLLTNRTYLPRAPGDRIRLIRRRVFNTVTGLRPDTTAAARDSAAT